MRVTPVVAKKSDAPPTGADMGRFVHICRHSNESDTSSVYYWRSDSCPVVLPRERLGRDALRGGREYGFGPHFGSSISYRSPRGY